MRNAMNTRRNQAGLSLIELMISITIGILVLTAVALVFVNTSRARAEIDRTSRQIENGRYAVEVLSDEIRLAGFYGELSVSGVTAPTALPADQCSTTVADWKTWIPLHIQGFPNAVGWNATTSGCGLADRKSGTDVILLRRAKTCYAGVSGCSASSSSKNYLQVSLCADETTTHDMATGTSALTLKKKDCSTTASVREYMVTIFYISTDNGQSVSVPTLKKIELDGTTWTTTALVEGIEEFHVEYGLDTSGDGAVDSYTDAPATVDDWRNVMTVKLWLLARNLEASPDFTDTKTYTLGAAAPETFTPLGSYRRHVYSSLVRIQNAAGRRETP
jgi:type IV pilus assembly protein PilW